MSKLSSTINGTLSKMKQTGGTGKGVYGEKAVLQVCEQIYQRCGGILYHSYTYKTEPDKAGNIKRAGDGSLYIEKLSGVTEIDVLLITPNKVFPIEVKAYKARKIVLTDEAIDGCFKVDKSPVHQNEMHCRHLYDKILQGVPYGDLAFIEPIVVFVDNASIEDRRSDWQKEYIKCTTLNRLIKLLEALDKPVDCQLDLILLDRLLRDSCVSSEKYLPVRIVE